MKLNGTFVKWVFVNFSEDRVFNFHWILNGIHNYHCHPKRLTALGPPSNSLTDKGLRPFRLMRAVTASLPGSWKKGFGGSALLPSERG